MSELIADSTEKRNVRARQAALATLGQSPGQSTDLIEYRSGGRVVVIGGAEAIEVAAGLDGKLKPQVLLTEGEVERGAGFPVTNIGNQRLLIDGYLGAFRIQLGEEGVPGAEAISADLVLDLGPSPRLRMAMKPPGYFVFPADGPGRDRVIDELSQMVGRFEKPRYFEYDASACAHGRAGKIACSRCIDVCPAEAITSLAESIEVNASLCQGGGVCATVCPSGAISYNYPTASDNLSRIRALLHSYVEHGGQDPVVVMVPDGAGELPALPQGNLLPVAVEELASTGLEVWLSVLSYGARALLLLDGGDTAPGVMAAVEEQIDLAGEVLTALGYDHTAISVAGPSDLTAGLTGVMPEIAAASFSGIGGKRQTAYLAIDHLYEQAVRPKPLVALPTGAPFGAAYVEANDCTLCMACVGVCPGQALQSGESEPQLKFIEANCLQCGMCTRTCPENAIWITPRLLFDRTARQTPRVLYEEQPFCCTSCGKPFATRSAIDSMLQKLQGHWMFRDERARKRLTMCEDCRVVDVVQDSNAMESGINGQNLQ